MTKSMLMLSAAIGPMSVAERAKGRYMRDETGHAPAPTPAPAPAAEPAAPAAPAEPALSTEQQLEQEFSSGDVDPATPAPDTEGVPKEAAEEKAPNPAQERIDEITAARREAERDASEARRESARLQAEVDRLTPKPAADGKVDVNAEPAPDDYEFGEADSRFLVDLSRFHARQEFQEQVRVAEVKGQIADMEVGYTQRITDSKIMETHPDFDEKVNKGAERGDWYCPPIVALGIKASEFGPDIAYHLASNVAESKRIAGLTPIEQAREFGILEGERRAAKKVASEVVPPNPTAAPTPPAARARGAGGKFSTEADTGDFAAFEAMADSVLKK